MRRVRYIVTIAAIALAAVMLAACAGTAPTPTPESTARILPEPPAFAKKVPVAPPRLNEDMEIVMARYRAGLGKANDTIECFVDWYQAVAREYGREKAEAAANTIRTRCDQRARAAPAPKKAS